MISGLLRVTHTLARAPRANLIRLERGAPMDQRSMFRHPPALESRNRACPRKDPLMGETLSPPRDESPINLPKPRTRRVEIRIGGSLHVQKCYVLTQR